MKKAIVIITFAFASVSCNNENLSAIANENQEVIAIQNFKRALISLNTPENRSTSDEKQAFDFPQMSERRKDLLLPSAKALIQAKGIDEREINRKTRNDRNALINWALDIYIKNSQLAKNKSN